MSKGHFVNMCIVIIGFLNIPEPMYLIVYEKKKKPTNGRAIALSCYNQMSLAHVFMFPRTTGQRMNKLTCHSSGFKGQNRILLSIERVGESNSETPHPISITPCCGLHGNWLISLPLLSPDRSRLVCNSS